jgi:hypothetical protein
LEYTCGRKLRESMALKNSFFRKHFSHLCSTKGKKWVITQEYILLQLYPVDGHHY